MDIRLEQPKSSRTQHLTRWVVRGVGGEFEIEQGAINNVHAKIYATIFEAAVDGIAQRYPTEDLKLLVQLEEVICDLNGITPEVRMKLKRTDEDHLHYVGVSGDAQGKRCPQSSLLWHGCSSKRVFYPSGHHL